MNIRQFPFKFTFTNVRMTLNQHNQQHYQQRNKQQNKQQNTFYFNYNWVFDWYYTNSTSCYCFNTLRSSIGDDFLALGVSCKVRCNVWLLLAVVVTLPNRHKYSISACTTVISSWNKQNCTKNNRKQQIQNFKLQ